MALTKTTAGSWSINNGGRWGRGILIRDKIHAPGSFDDVAGQISPTVSR